MDVLACMRKSRLFEALPEAELAELAETTVLHSFQRGAVIFTEGDLAAGFHLLVSGRVRVFKLSPDGKEQILHFFGPGDVLGEAAVFAGQPFPAHAESLEACTTLFLPRAAFLRSIEAHPGLALHMLAVLSRRLQGFTNLIENLSLREIPNRLAAYFVHLHRQSPDTSSVTIEMPKRQLAAMIGATPETLSRSLARLAKEGVIKAEGARGIRITDLKRLRQLADGTDRLA